MTREIIIKKLLDSQYSDAQATPVAEELLLIDNSLSVFLHKWIQDSTEMDVVVEGFSLMELKNKYQMTYPAALLTMDWLIKEPHVAINAINQGVK